ncbi:MAG: DUF4886 domain-containing protein [Clostridia bacterium]|nr:DUF4886 domain-containing protein [Clostridia bacterium]
MNILAIGNSFSLDANRYLHKIARNDGVDLTVIGLYIGGCSLSTHYRNMISDARAYDLDVNGELSGFYISMKEALTNREWDVVTFQQVSQNAPHYETYQPYLDELVSFVRKCAPKAKIYMHQTWAYEKDSKRLLEVAGYNTPDDMFADIEKSYKTAAEAIGADGVIPCGEVMQRLSKAGIAPVHRDTFHAHYGVSRYAMALLWYAVLAGMDVSDNTYTDFDVPVTEEERQIAIKCVCDIINK